MSLLPDPPLRISASVFGRAALLMLLCLTMTPLMAWYAVTELPKAVTELLRERAVWERGVPALEGAYEGEVSSNRFIFNSFKLKVTYVDQSEVPHEGKLEFSTIGRELDDAKAGEIRYDPKDPGAFVLSQALDLAVSRWASIAFFGVMSVGLIGLFGFLAYRVVVDLQHTLECARDGRLVEAQILSMKGADRYGTVTYTYRVKGDPAESKPRTGTLQRRRPIAIGEDGSRVLAVQSRGEPNAVVLLASDGYPFRLSPDARDRIMEGARAGRGLA